MPRGNVASPCHVSLQAIDAVQTRFCDRVLASIDHADQLGKVADFLLERSACWAPTGGTAVALWLSSD
jgi:hypothetical protein